MSCILCNKPMEIIHVHSEGDLTETCTNKNCPAYEIPVFCLGEEQGLCPESQPQ